MDHTQVLETIFLSQESLCTASDPPAPSEDEQQTIWGAREHGSPTFSVKNATTKMPWLIQENLKNDPQNSDASDTG